MMRVLVCGGRDYNNWRRICDTLCSLYSEKPFTHLIHGGAQGADRTASHWARMAGITQCVFQPQWNKHGKAAGPMRNQQMIDEGFPDLVIAFPGGRGTADMVWRAKAAGVEVREIEP